MKWLFIRGISFWIPIQEFARIADLTSSTLKLPNCTPYSTSHMIASSWSINTCVHNERTIESLRSTIGLNRMAGGFLVILTSHRQLPCSSFQGIRIELIGSGISSNPCFTGMQREDSSSCHNRHPVSKIDVAGSEPTAVGAVASIFSIANDLK